MRKTAGAGLRIAGLVALGLVVSACGRGAAEPAEPVQVALITDIGGIGLEIDVAAAPVTACNFLNYVADGSYEGGSFMAAESADDGEAPADLIQAVSKRGLQDAARPPIRLESTGDTGLSHRAGTLSMARQGANTATSSFYIVTEDSPALDQGGARQADGRGHAAFGRVVEGLDTARRIRDAARAEGDGRTLEAPVIIRVARIVGEKPAVCDKSR